MRGCLFVLQTGIFSSVSLLLTSATCLPSPFSTFAAIGYRGGNLASRPQSTSSLDEPNIITTASKTKKNEQPGSNEQASNDALLTQEERQEVLSGKHSAEQHTHKHDALSSEAVEAVWKRHRRWALVAFQRERSVKRARVQNLVFLVTGAALQTVALQTQQYRGVTRIVGGACLAAAPLLTNAYLSKEKISEWTRSRAISERIKQQIFIFRAGVAPYDGDDRLSAIQHLVDEVAGITESAKDLHIYYALAKADNVPPPPILDRIGYIHHRVEQQIDEVYKKRARSHAKRSAFLKKCKISLACGAATIGFVTGSMGSMGGATATATQAAVASTAATQILAKVANGAGVWGPTLAAASAAFAAYIHETHYDDEVEEYSASAQHLENMYLCLSQCTEPGSEEWSNFVLECESVIAATTQRWVNMKSSLPKKKAAAKTR